ncbi:hypothetical protein EDD16DRAFT_1825382, partial [Pisolithus croceorrhizus]
DGQRLAYLLRPTSPHGKDLVKEFRNPSVHHLDGCKPYRHVHRDQARDVDIAIIYGGSIDTPCDVIAV